MIMDEIKLYPTSIANEMNCLLTLLKSELSGMNITDEVVLVVPTSQTLEYEKFLMKYNKNGLFRISVTSTKKIQSTIHEKYGYGADLEGKRVKIITKAGIISRIYMILREKKNEFTYIRSPRISVAEAVYDVYENFQLNQYDALSLRKLCDIPTIPSRLKAVLHDLAIVFECMSGKNEKYLDVPGSDYANIDPQDAWHRMCKLIEQNDYFSGKTLVFCGFDEFHPRICSLVWSAALTGNVRNIYMLCRRFNKRALRRSIVSFTEYIQMRGLVRYGNEDYRKVKVYGVHNNSNGLYNTDIIALADNLAGNSNSDVFSDRMESISVYHAPDQYTECLYAAQKLIQWHNEGRKWSDLGIALDNEDIIFEILPLVLKSAGIPYFLAAERPLLQCSSAEYVSKVIACSGSYDQQEMLDIIKSGYLAGITAEEASLLENYAVTHGVKGSKWLKPFEALARENPDEIKRLNEIKDRAIRPIVEFHDRLKKRSLTLRDQAAEIYYFLERTGFYNKLKEKADEYTRNGMPQEAEFVRQSWESVRKYLDTIAMETYYLEHQSLEALSQITAEILYQSSVRFIPQTVDAVLISRSRMFVPESRKCCVLMSQQDREIDVHEPLLTSSDYRWIEENDSENHPFFMDNKSKSEERIMRENCMGVMSATDLLCISASMLSHSGKSMQDGSVYTTASKLLSDRNPANIHGGVQNNEIEPFAHDISFELLSGKIREFSNYGTGSLSMSNTDAVSEKWRSVFTHFLKTEPENMQKMIDALGARVVAENLPATIAKELYPNEVTSVSELEGYAACPYSHFVTRGLRPEELRKFEFQADQRGIFYHAAMEAYFRRAEKDPAFPQIDRKKIVSYFNEATAHLVEEMKQGPLAEDLLSRMQLTEYVQAARISAICVTYWLAESKYVPTGYEISFGKPNSQLPPLSLTLSDGRVVALSGKIDRVDTTTDSSGNTYGRVIDYKSSLHTLDREAVAEGYQLQLPLYLYVLLNANPGMRPAGALYQTILNPVVDVETDDEEVVKKKVLETFRLDGMYLDTDEFATESHGGALKKESTRQRKNIMAVSEDELKTIIETSKNKAEEHAEHMRTGTISIEPVTVCGIDPCKYCRCKTICGIGNAHRDEIGKESDD